MTLEIWIYLILFVVLFPAIWWFAGWLDRAWPDTTELMRSRGVTIREEDIPK